MKLSCGKSGLFGVKIMSYVNIVGLIISVGGLILVYIVSEIDHCRRGNDVYDWTKKLVKWIDKK